MVYKLLYSFTNEWFGFNIFKYITVRTALAAFTSLFISIILGPKIINSIRHLSHPNMLNFRENKKEDIPTMGGILVIGSLLLSTVFWAELTNVYILLLIFLTLWLAVFGIWDDYLKLKYKNHKGLRPLVKIVGQVGVGVIVSMILIFHTGINFDTAVYLPFIKDIIIPLGIYYVIFAVFIIVATSNAVNLTDGMDGLAIGAVLMVALAYGVISYMAGHAEFASYLNIPFVKGAAEVTVFIGALTGSCLGFLWFNCYPAEIFMGDTGSLTLGGILGLIAIIVKQEFSLLFVGGIFVIEALSVIIQVISFKTRRKRIFLMTPIHHHFELKGLSEPKVVIRFFILGIIFALFTVVTLKIR
jgi:phospho-N-acetylmuramoyl-pentapeptide-transferase